MKTKRTYLLSCLIALAGIFFPAAAQDFLQAPAADTPFDKWLAGHADALAELEAAQDTPHASLEEWLAEHADALSEIKPELGANSLSLDDWLAERAEEWTEAAPALPAAAYAESEKVYYSFNHYATNPKMNRTYVSKEMLQAAGNADAFKSSAYDISSVASRLTSLLSMHTHSVSTTKSVRADLAKVCQKSQYDHILQKKYGDVEMHIFCHRRSGKKIDELLVFRFRDTYCSRVIQLTGDLRTDDIARILKMSK